MSADFMAATLGPRRPYRATQRDVGGRQQSSNAGARIRGAYVVHIHLSTTAATRAARSWPATGGTPK